MTVRDLLTKAFRFTHILGAGEPMADDEASDALETMNGIIEQANLDKTLAYYETTVTFPFVASQSSYTIGPASTTPNVVAVRPVEILSGFTRRNLVDLPLFIGSKQDYDRIQNKDVGAAGWSQMVYYQAAWPKGTLYFYQKPLDALTSAYLNVMAEVPPFVTLDDTVSLPPGYSTWMQYKLGERLAPEYGFNFTTRMQALLLEVESTLKRNNMKPMAVIGTGLSSLAAGGGKYNITTDTSR